MILVFEVRNNLFFEPFRLLYEYCIYLYLKKTDLSVVSNGLKSNIPYRQRNFDYNFRIVWKVIHYVSRRNGYLTNFILAR